MKGTRSSSRFRENIKNKFSNTVDTALDADDDDFVNPPKGAAVVTAGQPVQGVAQEKQSVTPNIHQHPILIESTTVKKRKATNVGSSSKVVEKSVAKHVIDQMNELAYVYRLTFSCISLTKRSAFVKHINEDDLERIEKFEVANGGFGKAVEDKSVEDGEADERTEMYAAIFEHAYDKILTEKNNMEVALQEGLAKNPDCPKLLEWVEKKNELFNEESWKDGGVAEDSTERSPSHGSNSGDDEMCERDLSPITGVITEGVGKNEDICFKTPIGQPVNDGEGLK
ncbi:hypothetical protein L1887_35988 [Cichorium endivia]|nr:hypothetical protein L1887_35988 [Cichorium endivia]